MTNQMTPTELREAAKALAAKYGPSADVTFMLRSHEMYDNHPPVICVISDRGYRVQAYGATFEEAMVLAEAVWVKDIAVRRADAIAKAKATLAELEAA